MFTVRPCKCRDGVELISDRFRYGPDLVRGTRCRPQPLAYAKDRSLWHSHRAIIHVVDDSGTVIETHE
jgi:hypothetical protein